MIFLKTSGGSISFWLSEYPNFFFSANFLAFDCFHFLVFSARSFSEITKATL